MMFVRSRGCVSELSCLGWLSSFSFQSNLKPDCEKVLAETFASVLFQAVRCASLPVVAQLPPPLWARASRTTATVIASNNSNRTLTVRITNLPENEAKLLLCKRLSDRLFRKRRHNFVSGVVRKHSINRQLAFEVASVDERSVIIQIHRT